MRHVLHLFRGPGIALGTALCIFIAIELVVLLSGYQRNQRSITYPNSGVSFQRIAREIVNFCASSPYKPSCYEKITPLKTQLITMEDAFTVTKFVQRQDPSYAYCHVLGHALSARETAKNPDAWKEVIPRCPSGMCSNGCIHGAFQERFRSEVLADSQITTLKPDLQTVCEPRETWKPTGLEQATCYHAVGHLLMYITQAEIPKSLQLCDDVALKPNGADLRQICYDGVFMQLFQPLEPEDFALIRGKEPTRETVAALCNAYQGKQNGSCVSESWPLFRDTILTPQGLIAHCAKLRDAVEIDRCYMALFYVVTAQFEFDTNRIASYCNGLAPAYRKLCYANAASRFIETDYNNMQKAITLCQAASEKGAEAACYDELTKYATYNFHPGSESAQTLCQMLPDPWKTNCVTQ